MGCDNAYFKNCFFSVILESRCLESRLLWWYQQVSNALLGCAHVQELGFTCLVLVMVLLRRCLHLQQHAHLSVGALSFITYKNWYKYLYVPWYLLSDKYILPSLCIQAAVSSTKLCTMLLARMQNFLLDPYSGQRSSSAHCWKAACHLELRSWASGTDSQAGLLDFI